jgi:hypothetical protein
MQYSAACRHPLALAGQNLAFVAQAVFVVDLSDYEEDDGLDPR